MKPKGRRRKTNPIQIFERKVRLKDPDRTIKVLDGLIIYEIIDKRTPYSYHFWYSYFFINFVFDFIISII